MLPFLKRREQLKLTTKLTTDATLESGLVTLLSLRRLSDKVNEMMRD